jgi:hypothetical protein|nr:MAG TPA: minor capsid protein [Caudoviricetes sp.]
MNSDVYADYFKAVKGCSKAARNDFAKVWAMLDFEDKDYSISLLLDLLPGLVDKYGEAAATAAAEMYEAVMVASTGRLVPAELSETYGRKIVKSVYFASDLIRRGEYQRARSVLDSAIDYYTKQPARNTVYRNAKRDGARYARVPTGAETCEFCLMLASRGWVYHTEEAAGGKGNSYHTDCDCMPVVSFSKNPVVEGYDPDALHQEYLKIADKGKWNRAYEEKHGKAH